jgi:hypothetical protein
MVMHNFVPLSCEEKFCGVPSTNQWKIRVCHGPKWLEKTVLGYARVHVMVLQQWLCNLVPHGELDSKEAYVCCKGFHSTGSITELWWRLSKCNSLIHQTIAWRRFLSFVKSHLVDLVQYTCLRILHKFCHLLTTVPGGHHIRMLKIHTPDRSVRQILHSDLNFHPYKFHLHISSGTVIRGACNFVISCWK